MNPSTLDVICRDGIFLPIPGGVYFHPGQTRATVDLLALTRAMNAPRPAAGGPVFVPEAALASPGAIAALGRALGTLDRSHEIVLVPIPGDAPDPEDWLRAAETAGVQARLPVLPGTGVSARVVPVGADDRETDGTPVAVRLLPPGDVSARELLRTAARVAKDTTQTPLQRVRDLGAPASTAYPLAVGMVLTGTDANWDPARLTPPAIDEIWDRFRAGGDTPDDVPAALLSTPGSAALIRASGRTGAPLTWLFSDGETLWAAGTALTPAPARLLDAVRAPGATVAFVPAPASPRPAAIPPVTAETVPDGLPQIMIEADDPPAPDAVGQLRARMDRGAPAHPVFGTDWFGVRAQAPAPAFARLPDDVGPAMSDAFFQRLDLAARTGPVSLDALPATGAVLRNAAGQEMPLHIPMVWAGSPISPDNPAAAGFMAGAAQQARAAATVGYFTTLWVTEPPTAAGRAWAREHGIRLISVWDVYHAANPVDDEFLVRMAEHTVDGFTAAADILRWRIIDDFGGFYSDGDNRIEDPGAFDDEVRTLFARYGWAIHEGPPSARVGRMFNNSGILGARHHPMVQAFRRIFRDNHQRTQQWLMAALWNRSSGYGRSAQLVEDPWLSMRRNPLVWLAGPQTLNAADSRLPAGHLADDGDLPALRSVTMGVENSWHRRDPLAPVRRFTEAERPAVLGGLATALWWQIGFRRGDLNLPIAAPVVAGFADPDEVWRELLEPFLTEPELRTWVKTVTDQVLVFDPAHGVTARTVPLPDDLRVALGIDDATPRSWQLGESRRDARPVEAPDLRWTGLTTPGTAHDAVRLLTGWTAAERSRAAGNLPLVAAVLRARLGAAVPDEPVVAAAWARFAAAAAGSLEDAVRAYHEAREQVYRGLGVDPRSTLLPSSATLAGRLVAAGPDGLFPDPADRVRAVALSTESRWAGRLTAALDTLPPWDGTDPDCADRVADVLRALGVPLSASMDDAARGRDRLSARMNGRFQEPATADRLAALEIGAITPVWAVESAHMVLVHRHDAVHYTLVETQKDGAAGLLSFTGGRLPAALAGTVRLLGDPDRALLQAGLDTRTIGTGAPGSAAPGADRTAGALLDPGFAGAEAGMLRRLAHRPARPAVTVADDSVDYFHDLASTVSGDGGLIRLPGVHRRRVARDLVEPVIREHAPLRRDLVEPHVLYYRAEVRGFEVALRAAVDADSDTRVMRPLPLDDYLHATGLEWLAADLLTAGWTVVHGEHGEIRPESRQIVVNTLEPDKSVREAFLDARDVTLGTPLRQGYHRYRTADPDLHRRARVQAAEYGDTLSSGTPRLRHDAWSGLAGVLAGEIGVPPFRQVVLDPSGAVTDGRFDAATWTLTLHSGRSRERMLTALVRGLLQSERAWAAVQGEVRRGRPAARTIGVPPNMLNWLTRLPAASAALIDVAEHEWHAGSRITPGALDDLDALSRRMTPPDRVRGARLRRRLAAEQLAWYRTHLRYAQVPDRAANAAVERAFAASGSNRGWEHVTVEVDGFTTYPLGLAGVRLFAPDPEGPDGVGPVQIVRRPPVTGPLVVIDHKVGMVADGRLAQALRALTAQLPAGAVIELRPNGLLLPTTVIELAALISPQHRLVIERGLVDNSWRPGELPHFATFGAAHRPALGRYASHYQVRSTPFDPATTPTMHSDTDRPRYAVAPGVEAVVVSGRQLWFGEPGTEPQIAAGDPYVVIGVPGRETPWHVWQTALNRAADYALAAGERFAPEQVRIHHPQPMPATLPSVSPDTVLHVADADREAVRRLFGERVDPDRWTISTPERLISVHHLVDTLADLAGVPEETEDPSAVAAGVIRLARAITGTEDPYRLLALAHETARTSGLAGVTRDRIAALHSPPVPGMEQRLAHRPFRMADPELWAQARQWTAEAQAALAGADEAAWTALAHRLALAGRIPPLERVLLRDAPAALDITTWTLTLPRGEDLDRLLEALLRGLLRAEQYVVHGQSRVQRREVEPDELAAETILRVRNHMLPGPQIGDLRVDRLRSTLDRESRERAGEIRRAARMLDALRPPPLETATGRVRDRLAAAHRAWTAAQRQLDVFRQFSPRTAAEVWSTHGLRAGGSARDWSGTAPIQRRGYETVSLGRAGWHLRPAGATSRIDRRPPESGPLVVLELRPDADPSEFLRALSPLPAGSVIELIPAWPLTPDQAIATAAALGTAHPVTIGRDRLAGAPDARFAAYGRNHRPTFGSFTDHYRIDTAPDAANVRADVDADLGAGMVAHRIGERLWIGVDGTRPVILPGDPEFVVGVPGRTTPWLVWQTAVSRIAEFASAAGRELRPEQILVHAPEEAPAPVPVSTRDTVFEVTAADREVFRELFGAEVPPADFGDDVFLVMDALIDLSGAPRHADLDTIAHAMIALAVTTIGDGGYPGRRAMLKLAVTNGVDALTGPQAGAADITGAALHRVTDAGRHLFGRLFGEVAVDRITEPGFSAHQLLDVLLGLEPETAPDHVAQVVDDLAAAVTGGRGRDARRELLAVTYVATLMYGHTALTHERIEVLHRDLREHRLTEALDRGRDWLADTVHALSPDAPRPDPGRPDLGVLLRAALHRPTVRVHRVEVPPAPAVDDIPALLRPARPAVLEDALFAIRMAGPGVAEVTRTDPDAWRAWADATAALAKPTVADGSAHLPDAGLAAAIRRVARLVPDGTHPAARPLLALDAVLRTGVFPDNAWPAPMPVHTLGAWTTQPATILASVRAHAVHAGRPVIAVDLAGTPQTVGAVLAELRELLRWHSRLGPAPLVVGSRATGHAAKLFEEMRDELRPVALTTEIAGSGEAWRLRDTDGTTVGDLAAAPSGAVFAAAAPRDQVSGGLPVALAEWLRTHDPDPAEAYHRENRERLHDPAVAAALDRLTAAHPDDTRLAVFHTALHVARRAGGPVPESGPRPAVTNVLAVEPPWTADRGPVPVTVVYDYVRAGGSRRDRFPWDGLLFTLLRAGELTAGQVLSLLRATAVTAQDQANLTMMESIIEIRDLPDDESLLDADPMTHPRLQPIFSRIGRITEGVHGSYKDCLSPDDRVAWVGRLDAWATALTATGDRFQRMRADLLGVATYKASNC